MRYTIRALLMLALPFGAPRAQTVMMNPSQWYINNQIFSMGLFHSAIANSNLTRDSRGTGRRPGETPKPVVIPTQFRESPTTTIPALLSQNTAGLARTREESQRLFTSYIDQYKATMRERRFPTNDLASAFEYFIVYNFQIYHDLLNVPYEKDPRAKRAGDMFDRITAMSQKRLLQVTRAQEQTIVEQFRTRLGDNAAIRRMTDAQKQEYAELLATLFGVNHAAYMQGIEAEDEAQIQRGREMAKQGLERLLGAPIAQIRITNAGVEVVR
jgi:hypothetical protein